MPVKVLKKATDAPSSYFEQFKKTPVKKVKKVETIEDAMWKAKKGPNGRLPTEKQIKLVKKISQGETIVKSSFQVVKDVGYKNRTSTISATKSPVVRYTFEDIKARLESERIAILDEMIKKRKGANYGTLAMALGVVSTKIAEIEGVLPPAAQITIAQEDRDRIDTLLLRATGRYVPKDN